MPEIPEKIDKMIPQMNVGVPAEKKEEDKCIISDEQLVGIYGDILIDIKKDKEEIDHILYDFLEMVVSGGDASSASKEAVVNLLKMKTDQADKMTRVADLMTRLKLKDKDTFPRYLAAQQTNTINIGDNGEKKKALLDAINVARKEKEKQKEKKHGES